MAMLLKGGPVAAALGEKLSGQTRFLRERGIVPALAILRVGERPDDVAYEVGAVKRCQQMGVEAVRFTLPSDCGLHRLRQTVEEINGRADIHGCLMLRPLPERDWEEAAVELLQPEKDVDGMTVGSMASVFTGKGVGYPPCTAQACLELLDHYNIPLAGKRVTVVGRSLVVGRPLAMLLQARNATVTMCHTGTRDLPRACREGEILMVAAGRAGLITEEHVLPGQVVVDVGIHPDGIGGLRGDVDFVRVEPVVEAITPVPGGVGAVTTALLAAHVVRAAIRSAEGKERKTGWVCPPHASE